jgi:sugar lactone lactonase YvrE
MFRFTFSMTNKISTTHYKTFISLFISLFLFASVAQAGEPIIWQTTSRAELLKGEARGVSVTDTGALMLAPRFAQLFNTEQAYVWAMTADGAGNIYLGTGHDGRLYRVGADGKGALLYDAPELDVTALAVGRDGTLYAGTSPDGKVYRVGADGKAEVYFDPPDKYIWSLALMPDGALAVGTGDNGKLYRVKAANTKPEASLLIDTNETHVISLAVTSTGELIAGTDPGGLVLRISPEGKAFALFDAPLREIHTLATAPDGSIYALALSEAASASRVSSSAPTPQTGDTSGGGQGSSTVTITSIDESGNPIQGGQGGNPKSRNDLSNARSAVFRILPDGGTDVLWSSGAVTAFAVAPLPQGGGVLIGTADKGRIYSVTNDGRDTLLLQSTEGQISSFATRGREVFAATSNQGKLFRFGADAMTEGSYESPVRDAKLVASWGRIWWRGVGNVELQTRSGNSERPDATWSDWSASYRDPVGAQISSPRARFIQWRAILHAPATGAANVVEARMEDVSIAYLQRNVAPEVLSIAALPNGVGLQQMVQVPADPNIESSGLDPSIFGIVQQQIAPRRLYQRGARSLQWQAEDRNGDTLEYALYYRSLNEASFRLLKDKLRDNFYTIDGATLADGRYVFKVVATDAPDNANGLALTGERVSEPLDVDNTPPVVRSVGTEPNVNDHARVTFEVEDATGMVRRADVSVDGAPWRAAFPDDGLADSPRERYSLDIQLTGAGEHTISLRAFDASGNIGSARVLIPRSTASK